jgi:hypothetical protein
VTKASIVDEHEDVQEPLPAGFIPCKASYNSAGLPNPSEINIAEHRRLSANAVLSDSILVRQARAFSGEAVFKQSWASCRLLVSLF